MKKLIEDEFNPHSIEDLRDFYYMSQNNGILPNKSRFNSMSVSGAWQIIIMQKLSMAYVEAVRAGKVIGMPSFEDAE